MERGAGSMADRIPNLPIRLTAVGLACSGGPAGDVLTKRIPDLPGADARPTAFAPETYRFCPPER